MLHYMKSFLRNLHYGKIIVRVINIQLILSPLELILVLTFLIFLIKLLTVLL